METDAAKDQSSRLAKRSQPLSTSDLIASHRNKPLDGAHEIVLMIARNTFYPQRVANVGTPSSTPRPLQTGTNQPRVRREASSHARPTLKRRLCHLYTRLSCRLTLHPTLPLRKNLRLAPGSGPLLLLPAKAIIRGRIANTTPPESESSQNTKKKQKICSTERPRAAPAKFTSPTDTQTRSTFDNPSPPLHASRVPHILAAKPGLYPRAGQHEPFGCSPLLSRVQALTRA